VAKTMKAAVVRAFGKPLTIEEVTIPTPAAGQILVKVLATGVCHTDLHAADGDWPVKPTLPFVPGHEGAGIVAALGAGVSIRPASMKRIAPSSWRRASGSSVACSFSAARSSGPSRRRWLPISAPVAPSDSRRVHVYHQYVIRTARRAALQAHLRAHEIDTAIHYPAPIHRQRAWLTPFGEPPPLPNAERAAAEMLSLPVHPDLTDAEVERVADAVAGFFQR
jgi:hypothetical protein